MSEKLKITASDTAIMLKINELVDAVNELQEMCKSCDNQIGISAEQIAELQHDDSEKVNCQENVQDKFAEQRKWIGKLCWFWDDDKKDGSYGILGYIKEGWKRCYVQKGHYFAYEHCEPASEDLIYKGGNNE